jgi:molecular chaperone HscB
LRRKLQRVARQARPFAVMSSVLTQNYFDIFSLPQRYGLDRGSLDTRYRDLQRSVHPDRFVSGSDQERRVSMQQAARINEAYQVLRNPLKRGRYLLELRGIHLDDRQGAHQDAGFLMQQMELRESLADVRQQDDPRSALDRLGGDIEARFRELEARLGEVLDADAGDAAEAAELVQKMQFFARLRDELQQLEADLEDELL